MNKPIETIEDFLNETVSFVDGKPVKRKDTMALTRINFLRENFPIIFAAGHASGMRDARRK